MLIVLGGWTDPEHDAEARAKARYDATNLFRLNSNIQPATARVAGEAAGMPHRHKRPARRKIR